MMIFDDGQAWVGYDIRWELAHDITKHKWKYIWRGAPFRSVFWGIGWTAADWDLMTILSDIGKWK